VGSPPTADSINFGEVDSRTAPLIASAMGDEGDLVASRLARGCRCFAAWAGGDVAGYGWLSTAPEWIGELQLQIAPEKEEGYIWNCVTLPGHRRRGVFTLMLVGIIGWGRDAGLRRLWIGSVAIPAEKAVRPAGFRPALEFSSGGFMGLHWLAIKPSAEADSNLVEAGCRVLSVRPGSSVHRSKHLRH
jgi:GNAT superfamily N-acetyltransferase